MSEQALVLRGVSKSFADHVAVQDLSLEVPRGSVFGLLGPNGAGKTTTLRMVMDILGTDSGSVELLGRPADGAARDRVGYMPEERGLYKGMVLQEQMVFMASIKGVPRKEAARKLAPWLERLGLAEWKDHKTSELSKGMQQKAQFIATVLHEPELIIMDEPMSGLDPVGMNVMRDAMVDLSRSGITIVLSSHQMETVEKLCDRVALINKGRKVLDGAVSAVKEQYGHNTLILAFDGDGAFLASLPGVDKVSDFKQYVEIQMADGADPQALLALASEKLAIRRFEIVVPSLHDIFVEAVTGAGQEAA